MGEDFRFMTLLFRKFRIDSPVLPLTRLLFTKPWGRVEFRVRVSATKFSSLPSLPRASQWTGGSMGFPWPWHIWCLPGDGVGEIMLGLVGPKRLLKKKKKKPSQYCHFFLKSQLYFTSIEGGHKLSATYSTELRTIVFKCFLHL